MKEMALSRFGAGNQLVISDQQVLHGYRKETFLMKSSFLVMENSAQVWFHGKRSD